MTIVLVGLNYQHTPIELREKLHLVGENLHKRLLKLHSETLPEVAILATCNRLELYTNTPDANQAIDTIIADMFSVENVQVYRDSDAVCHLMRVAAGLESLVLGESEILGQVVYAFQQAKQAGTMGAVLSRLFQDAIRTGKRARTETKISQHTLSVSHAAILMAKRQIHDFTQVNALVIGAGRMAELAVSALKTHNARSIQIINRTFAKADTLARQYGVEARTWDHLQASLSAVDVVITATSAPYPILCVEDMPKAKPQVVIDIAVPRNVDQVVRQLPNICLYDIDDLQTVVDDHRTKRQSEIVLVEAIIAEESRRFWKWANSRGAVSTIVDLRQKAEILVSSELERAFNRMPDLTEHEREVMTHMAHRLVNKLLHSPLTALHDQTVTVELVRQLFGLENDG